MTIKDYKLYRKAILSTVALVIVLVSIGLHFFTNEKDEAFSNNSSNTDTTASTTKPENYSLMNAPSTQSRTANALETQHKSTRQANSTANAKKKTQRFRINFSA